MEEWCEGSQERRIVECREERSREEGSVDMCMVG